MDSVFCFLISSSVVNFDAKVSNPNVAKIS